jgi:hypothetical protein
MPQSHNQSCHTWATTALSKALLPIRLRGAVKYATKLLVQAIEGIGIRNARHLFHQLA